MSKGEEDFLNISDSLVLVSAIAKVDVGAVVHRNESLVQGGNLVTIGIKEATPIPNSQSSEAHGENVRTEFGIKDKNFVSNTYAASTLKRSLPSVSFTAMSSPPNMTFSFITRMSSSEVTNLSPMIPMSRGE